LFGINDNVEQVGKSRICWKKFPQSVFAQCNQASCSGIQIELRVRRRPDFGIEAPGHFLFAAATS
ncbi:MAG: hypothetical protein WBF44_16880, partial [Pseudolabrys sp.]